MKLVSPYTYELLRGLLCSPTVCPIADSVPHRHRFCTVAMPRRLRPATATWAANTAELPCPVGLFWPYVTSSAKQTELATTTADQRQSLFATVRVTGARWVPLASTHGLRRRVRSRGSCCPSPTCAFSSSSFSPELEPCRAQQQTCWSCPFSSPCACPSSPPCATLSASFLS